MEHWWKSGLAMAGLALLCLAIAPGIGGAEGTKGKQSDKAGVSCVAPAKGPVGATGTPGNNPAPVSEVRARVGQPAPDFEANALVNGGFKNLKLSDYKGKWVVMCFYPGDFTFV